MAISGWMQWHLTLLVGKAECSLHSISSEYQLSSDIILGVWKLWKIEAQDLQALLQNRGQVWSNGNIKLLIQVRSR